MAAYTDSLGFTKGSAGIPARSNDRITLISVDLDFAKIAAARAAAGVPALTALDTLEVLPLPAGALVLSVGAQVTKAEGAAGTVDVGDAASATRYLTNLDLNALGNTASTLDAPFLYAAAGSLVMTIDTAAIDMAKVRLWVLVANTND